MLQIYNKENLGHVQTDWLDSRHHFSFGHYYDENRMGFGHLRVVNDDLIRSGHGFPLHPHKDMEIITYVRAGTIIHKDSLGNLGRTKAGDVQVMTAGTGIAHSEFADADAGEDTKIFQIWIEPRARGFKPAWGQAEFPKEPVSQRLNLLVSGREADKDKGALTIQQDAAIFGGRLTKGTVIQHPIAGQQAYVLVSDGQANVNGVLMHEGDGAEITKSQSLSIEGVTDTEVLVIDL